MKSIILKTGLEILEFVNATIDGVIVVTFYLLESLVAGGMAWKRLRRDMRAQSFARIVVSRDRIAQPSRSSGQVHRNYRVAA
jgi:hypothetical protein